MGYLTGPDEAGTIRDGGGIRAFAWRDALQSLGFDVNFVGLYADRLSPDAFTRHVDMIVRSIT